MATLRRIGSLIIPASLLAALAVTLGPATAQASVSHRTFMVEDYTYVKVTIPAGHGPLIHFAVGYKWDRYIHQDNISAASNVREIDNYTGQQPDTYGYDGCANSRVPDQLTTTDNDKNGIPGQQRHTILHRRANLTFTPRNFGKAGYSYFLWCHYEHGPESWVTLTFKDGSTVHLVWGTPVYFKEISISRAGTATTADSASDDV